MSLIAKDQLLSIIERAERLHEERAAIADDLKELYGEARGNGYDVPALKEIVKIRAKVDDEKAQERNAIVDTYMVALGMIPATRVQAHDDEGSSSSSVRSSADAKNPPAEPEASQRVHEGSAFDDALSSPWLPPRPNSRMAQMPPAFISIHAAPTSVMTDEDATPNGDTSSVPHSTSFQMRDLPENLRRTPKMAEPEKQSTANRMENVS